MAPLNSSLDSLLINANNSFIKKIFKKILIILPGYLLVSSFGIFAQKIDNDDQLNYQNLFLRTGILGTMIHQNLQI